MIDEGKRSVESQMLAAFPAVERIHVVAQKEQTILLRLPDHRHEEDASEHK
jgi:hypothetical protein